MYGSERGAPLSRGDGRRLIAAPRGAIRPKRARLSDVKASSLSFLLALATSAAFAACGSSGSAPFRPPPGTNGMGPDASLPEIQQMLKFISLSKRGIVGVA